MQYERMSFFSFLRLFSHLETLYSNEWEGTYQREETTKEEKNVLIVHKPIIINPQNFTWYRKKTEH